MLRILAANKTVEMKRQMSMDIGCVNGGKQGAILNWHWWKHPQSCSAVCLAIYVLPSLHSCFKSVFKSEIKLFRPFSFVRFHFFEEIVWCTTFTSPRLVFTHSGCEVEIFVLFTFNEAQRFNCVSFFDLLTAICVSGKWRCYCERNISGLYRNIRRVYRNLSRQNNCPYSRHLNRIVWESNSIARVVFDVAENFLHFSI